MMKSTAVQPLQPNQPRTWTRTGSDQVDFNEERQAAEPDDGEKVLLA
jgi:hypothetical protein